MTERLCLAWAYALIALATIAHADDAPTLSPATTAAQAGQELVADTQSNGHRNHYGVLLGFSRAER